MLVCQHIVAFLALCAWLAPSVALAQPSTTPLNSMAFGGNVTDVERVGGTLFVAGDFLGVSPAADVFGGLAVVNNAAGTRVLTTPRIRGPVYATVPDGAGGYYIAGGFFDIFPAPSRNGVAHIRADGSVDPTFNPPVPNGDIYAMVRVANTLYLGGAFTYLGNQPRAHLAALNATTGALLLWNPTTNADVSRMIISGTTLYIGGWFTSVSDAAAQPNQMRNRLAAIDLTANAFAPWNPNANSGVNDLVISGATAYIAGHFTMLGGQPRQSVAAVDTASGAVLPWDPSPNRAVRAIAVIGSTVVLGGDFTLVGGQARRGLAAVDASSGALTPWAPHLNDRVFTIAATGNVVYAGGSFTAVDGTVRGGAAAFDFGATGALQPWNPSMNGTVSRIDVDAARVALGGTFNATNAIVRRGVAALDPASGNVLPWNARLGGAADRVTSDGTTLFVSGFAIEGSLAWLSAPSDQGFQAFDVLTGARPGGWTPSVSSAVDAIAISGSNVLLSVVSQNRVEVRDVATGGSPSTFVTYSTNGRVEEILPVGDRVYLAGEFTAINGTTRNNLAVVDLTSRALLPMNVPVNGPVDAIALEGNTLYIGGRFTSVGGQARQNLAAIDVTSNIVTSWSPSVNSDVRDIAVHDGLVFVGGFFSTANGQTRSFSATFTTGGALTPYEPFFRSWVYTLLADDDFFIAGGSFDYVGSTPPLGLAIFRRLGGAPEGLRATVAGNQVTFSWSRPGGVGQGTTYVLEAGMSAGTTFISQPVGAITQLSVTAPNGTFYVRVRAQTPTGLGPPSNEVVVNTPSCSSLAAPTGLVNVVNGSLVSLAWNPVAGASGYVLEAGLSSGASNVAVAPVGAVTSLQANAPASHYFVRVRATSPCTTSGPSNETIVTVIGPQPPGAPSNLTSVVSGSTVSLSWTPPTSGGAVTTYVIEVGTGPNTPSNIVVTAVGPNPALVATNVPAATYCVRIRGRNAAGDGPPTAQVVVTLP